MRGLGYKREQRDRIIAKRLRRLQKYVKGQPFLYPDGNWVRNPGTLAKRDEFDCGHTKCLTCHGGKLIDGKGKSVRDRRNGDRLQDHT